MNKIAATLIGSLMVPLVAHTAELVELRVGGRARSEGVMRVELPLCGVVDGPHQNVLNLDVRVGSRAVVAGEAQDALRALGQKVKRLRRMGSVTDSALKRIKNIKALCAAKY